MVLVIVYGNGRFRALLKEVWFENYFWREVCLFVFKVLEIFIFFDLIVLFIKIFYENILDKYLRVFIVAGFKKEKKRSVR